MGGMEHYAFNVIVVNKDHYIISSGAGFASPEGARALIDAGLNMTEEEFQQNSESDKYLNVLGLKRAKDNEAFDAEFGTYYNVYNINNNMSMTVDCPGMKQVVVDSNLKILQSNRWVGEFYIVPEGTEKVSVTIHTEKGFNASKANMVHNSDYELLSFKKAIRDKNDYTFELELGESYWQNSFTFYASDELGSITMDSYIGVIFFLSDNAVNKYFESMTNNYHHDFNWHIEEIPEEVPAE